jgi:hypothetical protein
VISRRLPIAIRDARYPGGEAQLLAWDAWQEQNREGARYLLLATDGSYFVHEVIREGRGDRHREQIRQVDAADAQTLYREFSIRIADAIDVRAIDGQTSNQPDDRPKA